MSSLGKRALAAAPPLERWIANARGELTVGRLPRAAWPIVAGAVVRACAALGRPVLILVPAPQRFADELRPWLAGNPPVHVFAEVGISFLDRPPAFDEAVNKRLEALAALSRANDEPAMVVVSSRRAITRQTISPRDLEEGTVLLTPGQGPDPVAVALRLVELGYSREPLVEDRGQFSLRGGILDVFPAAADAPVRAEWAGDVIETLRLFDPENQRSVMAVPEASIRTGRELLLGPGRGAAAVARLREAVSLASLRADVDSEWEDELVRLESGSAFPGVEFYAGYLDPARPSLLDHVPAGAAVLDFDPNRQLVDARSVIEEAEMLAAAESEGGELPRGYALPIVGVDRLDDFAGRARLLVTSGEAAADAIDLGWTESEPLVSRPRAAADLAVLSERSTVVFATEQDERLRAFLDESGVRAAVVETELDLDLELEPALRRADIDIAAGCSQDSGEEPDQGIHPRLLHGRACRTC